ncbi:phenylacetate-CoA ligase [Stackebrandtia endophytica]|uniref:Phenylacetate-CoA ligase n=1 Tax=Stackebrandtia endophytica TaxID=1496996 RepID=A0A543AT90_9ACTN|nr:AMP-binding protein [Stackebrandtia endophytica]TQL75725.1 phenylacetate-CoA ligase [Stackebrandtia endophytica]
MIGQLGLGYQAWRAQWLSKPKLDQLRTKRLRHTLAIAAQLPFYRDHWKDVDLTEITGPADLRGLPTIGKPDFRGRLDDITVPTFNESNARVTYTSGSSGATLRLTHDWPSTLYCNAAWIRAHMAYGLKPHQRTAYFRFEPVKQGLTAKLRIFRNEFVPFESGDAILADLRRIRPHVLGGYPSYFADLIRMVPHDDLRALGVRWLYAGAETMPAPLAKQLKRIFDCPLIDMYGSTEFENMAFECTHGNRHVTDDSIILEVLNAEGEPAAPGEIGDIVVTGLRNDAMPLVRYRIGDRGAWSDQTCPCGRNFMLLPRLEGRSLEAVVTPTGKRYPVILLDEDLIHIDELFQFQVVQEAPDRLTLNLVCAPGTEAETTQRAVKALVDVFDEPMTVTPKVVSAIPRGSGGKVKAIIPLEQARGN